MTTYMYITVATVQPEILARISFGDFYFGDFSLAFTCSIRSQPYVTVFNFDGLNTFAKLCSSAKFLAVRYSHTCVNYLMV